MSMNHTEQDNFLPKYPPTSQVSERDSPIHRRLTGWPVFPRVVVGAVFLAVGCTEVRPAAKTEPEVPSDAVPWADNGDRPDAAGGVSEASKASTKLLQGAGESSASIWTPTICPKPNAGGTQRLGMGEYHNCAVATSGSLKCWYGLPGRGQTESTRDIAPAEELTKGVIAVAAGEADTCAINAEGGVFCWDRGFRGWDTPIAIRGLASNAVAITSGLGWKGSHTCVLTASGKVYCWGRNGHRQAGYGSLDWVAAPTPLTALPSTIRSISAGQFHTCALAGDGQVFCWGDNSAGQLGTWPIKVSAIPKRVVGLPTTVRAISAGCDHTCAITESDKVFCWGGSTEVPGYRPPGSQNTSVPTEVRGLEASVVAVATGDRKACAFLRGGQLLCWNSKELVATAIHPNVPSGMPSPSGCIEDFALGRDRTCLRTSVGEVLCGGSIHRDPSSSRDSQTTVILEAVVGFP